MKVGPAEAAPMALKMVCLWLRVTECVWLIASYPRERAGDRFMEEVDWKCFRSSQCGRSGSY